MATIQTLANTPQYGYDPDQEAIARKQRLVDAMQASSLSPIEAAPVVGGMMGKTSPLHVLVKVLQAYQGRKGNEALGEERKALAERQQQDLTTGATNWANSMSAPAPGPTATPDEREAFRQSKIQAIMQAVASNNPTMKEIGMAQLKQMGGKAEGGLTAKDVWGSASPEAQRVMAAQSGVQGFEPATPKPIMLNPTDIPMIPGTNGLTPAKIAGGPGPAPEQVTINGDLYEKNPVTQQLRKLDNAPKVTTNVNASTSVVNKGESKFMEQMGTDMAKNVQVAREAKVNAQRTIASMQKLEDLDTKGVYGGPTASLAMTAGTLAESLGVPVDKAKLANSQTYQGELMNNLTANLTGSLARSTTDKDMELLQQPMPMLLNSKEGRAAIRRQVIAQNKEKIDYANQVEDGVRKSHPEAASFFSMSPANSPVPPRMDAPGAPGKAIPLADYLKSKGH